MFEKKKRKKENFPHYSKMPSLVKSHLLGSPRCSLAVLFPMFIACLMDKGGNFHNAFLFLWIHCEEISHSMDFQPLPYAEVITASPVWLCLHKLWNDVCFIYFSVEYVSTFYLFFSELRPRVKALESRNHSICHPVRTVSYFPEFQSPVKM